MDKRTEYRVVFQPKYDRWVAQYRRWWSPFWATGQRCAYGGELPIFVPVFFVSKTWAEEWCREDAEEREAERLRRRQPVEIVNLGRLP